MTLIGTISDEEAAPETKLFFRHGRTMFDRVANALHIASRTPWLAHAISAFIVAACRSQTRVRTLKW